MNFILNLEIEMYVPLRPISKEETLLRLRFYKEGSLQKLVSQTTFVTKKVIRWSFYRGDNLQKLVNQTTFVTNKSHSLSFLLREQSTKTGKPNYFCHEDTSFVGVSIKRTTYKNW